MKMGASVRKICEKCRLIRRKGRIRVICSISARVVVWAASGPCDSEGRPGVDDRASELQTESQNTTAEEKKHSSNRKDSLPLESIPIDRNEYIGAHPDGGGIDLGYEEHLQKMRQFEQEILDQKEQDEKKKQLKHFFFFIFILAVLRWRFFALFLGHVSLDYLIHHSPYRTRITHLRNFISRVVRLFQSLRRGSISFRESLKLFRVLIARLQRALHSKSSLDPQALSFIIVFGNYVRVYSRHAGIPLFTPIYNPLMALSILILWITLPNKKWKLPIMLIYSIFISIFFYYEFYSPFKGPFKPVDRRGHRRSDVPYNNKK